jgi:hypothetical protein
VNIRSQQRCGLKDEGYISGRMIRVCATLMQWLIFTQTLTQVAQNNYRRKLVANPIRWQFTERY